MKIQILSRYLWKHNIDGYVLLKFVKYFKTTENFILHQSHQIDLPHRSTVFSVTFLYWITLSCFFFALGGSLFLFDRKVLRYFRKDGHNWRKKKDGKTVKEAHERLKVGSVDMLHCYYAHGEENEKFQRRSYWMLDEELMHIVLVHYREVKDKPSLSYAKDVEEVVQVTQMDNLFTSSSATSQGQLPSQTMDTDSPISAHTSEYEDAESGTSFYYIIICCASY
ncbi:unnamed protein product [Musa textilis]